MPSYAEELEMPRCVNCKWKYEAETICKAYPFGIPTDILMNRLLHDEVFDDQIGDYVYAEE